MAVRQKSFFPAVLHVKVGFCNPDVPHSVTHDHAVGDSVEESVHVIVLVGSVTDNGVQEKFAVGTIDILLFISVVISAPERTLLKTRTSSMSPLKNSPH